MRRRPKPITFQITLSGPEATSWPAFAESRGLTLEQLVREAVELVMLRGATR